MYKMYKYNEQGSDAQKSVQPGSNREISSFPHVFIFIHPTHYFLSLFSSFIQLGFEISFTLFQKLFPSIVRLHKWEIRAEDSSILRFQIATFLRFSCRNLQLSLGRKRFRRGQLHENMHHHQPQNFCPTFLL